MATLERIPISVISQVPVFDANVAMTKVLPAVHKNRAVLINKDGAFYGIIDFRSVHRESKSLRLNKNAPALKYAIKVPKIMRTTSLDDAIFYFYRSKRNALPYVDGDKVIGILDRFTLMKMVLSMEMLNGIKCKDIMTSPALAIDAQASIAQASSAMADHNKNRLLVLENGKMAGLVTRHDLISKFTITDERYPEMKSKRYSPSNITISNIMERNVQTVNVNDDIRSAVQSFVKNSISSLIVLNNDMPAGILTVSDVLASLIAQRKSYENRIIISGIDRSTYEYEYDIKEQANAFIEKVEKFRKVNVQYISINIKNLKNSRYEINARANVEKCGAVEVRITDFLLDRTFSKVLQALMESIKKKKDISEKKRYDRVESV
ncbi:MAG: CBS domain-containing protein [Candidatus Marsarchaeota archaeon]|jgi:CBS-domain-containing membrane protein|nr:CBS domain-containing protein [Candidatus Marsarchaeota archaeon]